MDHGQEIAVTETYPKALFDAVMDAVPRWIDRAMTSVVLDQRGEVSDSDRNAIDHAAAAVVESVRTRLARLLAEDVDAQTLNPLAVLRGSTGPATETLREMGLRGTHRDEFERASMPDDDYAIGPLTWRDLGEDVHEAGIAWGAWKAATVLSRRRDEGRIS